MTNSHHAYSIRLYLSASLLKWFIKAHSGAGRQAFLIEHDKDTIEFVGNRTECALLMLQRKWLISYKDVRNMNAERIVQVCPVAWIVATEMLSDADHTVSTSLATRALSPCVSGVWLLVREEDGVGSNAYKERIQALQQGRLLAITLFSRHMPVLLLSTLSFHA